MREMSAYEISFVSGGDGNSPSCPSGTTMTSATYDANGKLQSYTCTTNQEVQKSDWAVVGAIVAAAAAVVVAVVSIATGAAS